MVGINSADVYDVATARDWSSGVLYLGTMNGESNFECYYTSTTLPVNPKVFRQKRNLLHYEHYQATAGLPCLCYRTLRAGARII